MIRPGKNPVAEYRQDFALRNPFLLEPNVVGATEIESLLLTLRKVRWHFRRMLPAAPTGRTEPRKRLSIHEQALRLRENRSPCGKDAKPRYVDIAPVHNRYGPQPLHLAQFDGRPSDAAKSQGVSEWRQRE